MGPVCVLRAREGSVRACVNVSVYVCMSLNRWAFLHSCILVCDDLVSKHVLAKCVLVFSEPSLALNAACGLVLVCNGGRERGRRARGQRDRNTKSACPVSVRMTHASQSLCGSASA